MKNMQTEYNNNNYDEEEKEKGKKNKNRYFYKASETVNVENYKINSTFDTFLDYTFKQKRNKISREKNKSSLMNYNYELEQTISLNLDLIHSFFRNANMNNDNQKNKKIIIYNDNKSKDTSASSNSVTTSNLLVIIKTVIEKFKKKTEITKNISNLTKKINLGIDYNKNYNAKIKEQKLKYKKNIHKTNDTLDSLDNKIISMNKKFYKIQEHLDNNPIPSDKNQILNKSNKRNIFNFIYSNISYKKDIANLRVFLARYYDEAFQLRLDNIIFKEKIELCENKALNKDLLRCMEYYRQTNADLFFTVKKLKKRYGNIIKIMKFLNLESIVQFSKKKNDEEENYEIEFSRINKA